MDDAEIATLLTSRELMIFDFDGTLADTTALHIAAFAEVLAPFAVAVDYASIAGRKTRDALQVRLASVGITLPEDKLDAIAGAKQQRVRALIQERLRPMPGVDRFLRWAALRSRLAIYSSGSRGTMQISLERLGYGGWFDPLLCAEDVTRAKPDPEGFLRVLALTSTPAPRAVVFEDADAGVMSARAAGVAVIDVRVTSFEQLARTFA